MRFFYRGLSEFRELSLWMGRQPVIAVDVMGGDCASDEIVAGAWPLSARTA